MLKTAASYGATLHIVASNMIPQTTQKGGPLEIIFPVGGKTFVDFRNERRSVPGIDYYSCF